MVHLKLLMKCMPTWVAIPSMNLINGKWTLPLWDSLKLKGLNLLGIAFIILREYPRQPWDRAAAEMEGVLKDQIEEERKLKFPLILMNGGIL